MLNNRLYRRTAHFISRGGFTLVELLVVIAIIAILAGVALGPITAGIKKAQQSGAVQTCKSLQLGEFQYGVDTGNNAYPSASTLGGFVALMYPTYISDLGTLIVSGAPGAAKYTGAQPITTLDKTTDSYDFSYYSGTTSGLTATTPDSTPAVWTGGSTLTISATGGAAVTITVDASSPFTTTGLAVCFKGGSARFITGATVTMVDASYPNTGSAVTSFGGW